MNYPQNNPTSLINLVKRTNDKQVHSIAADVYI